MLREMSSRTLAEWIAYHGLEPFGDELTDIHFARLNATIIDVNRGKKGSPTDPKKFRLWKFFERFDPQEYFNQLKAGLTFKKWD